jgi:alpha-beta hydrolase superfamily lysophospholipase
MVVDGRGDDLIPLTLWYKAISATSLLERMAEPPGRFEEAMSATRAPVLMLVGGRESRVADWERMTNQLPSPEKKFVVIDGSEHNFIGFEEQAVDAIAGFLRTHLQ